MLNRYGIVFLLCMLGTLLPLRAQQSEAKSILMETARRFREAGGIEVSFIVRTSEGTSMGALRMKGEKFRLESEGMTTWFDGHTQWSYLPSSDEVNVSEPTPEELQSINPYTLLSLDEHGYKLKLSKIGDAQDDRLHKLVLNATDRKRDLQCIILYVSKESFRPVRISMARRGGDVVVIAINSYKEGQAYPDSFFTFDKAAYPTAEVVDLR